MRVQMPEWLKLNHQGYEVLWIERSVQGHTIITKVAIRFFGLNGNEGSNEVVDDGCDKDNQQEDLGL